MLLLFLLFLSSAAAVPLVPPAYKPLWKAKDVDALCTPPSSLFSFTSLLPAGPGSSDLGLIPLFDCTSNETDPARTCVLPSLPELSLAGVGAQPLALLGAAALGLLHVAAALLVVGCTFCCVWCRYGGPAFCKRWWPSVCMCCAAYPTARGKHSVTGFIEFPNTGGTFGYTPRVVLRTRVTVVALLALLTGLMVSSYTAGSVALTSSMLLAADAQKGFGRSVQQLLLSSAPLLNEFALAVSDASLGGLLRGINTSLSAPGVSLRAASGAMGCVNASFHQLPNASTAFELARAAKGALDAVQINAQVLVMEVDKLKTQRVDLTGFATQLSGNLTLLGWGLGNLTPPLGAAAAQAAALVPLKGALVDNGGGASGLLVDIAGDLNAVGGFWPSASDTGAVGSALAGWAAAGTDSGRTMPAGALAANLSALLATRLRPLPDLNLTVMRLLALNASVNALAGRDGTLAALAASLNATAAAVGAIPPYSSFAPALLGLNTTAYAISFADSMAAVTTISATLAALPDFPALFAQLARMGNLSAVLPCVGVLAEQVRAVNATLYRLPAAFDRVVDLLAMLNDTQQNALLAATAVTRFPLANSSFFLGTFNASALFESFDGLQRSVVSQRDGLRLPNLFSAFVAMNGTLTAGLAGALRSYAAAAGALGASLGASAVPAPLVASLLAAQTGLNAALNLTRLGELEYGAQARGHCNSTLNFCSSDGDCPASAGFPSNLNRCNVSAAGLKRCANNWLPLGPQLNTPGWWAPDAFSPLNTTNGPDRSCRSDADCVVLKADAFCVGDPSRAAALAGALGALSLARAAIVATAVDTNTTVLAAGASARGLDIVSAAAQLNTAAQLAGNVTVPATASQLAGLLASFGNTNYDAITSGLGDMQARIAGVNTTLMLVVFENMKSMLDSFAQEFLPIVSFSARLLDTLQTVFVDQAGANVKALSRATLSLVGSRAGISGVLAGDGAGNAGTLGTLDALLASLFTGWGGALGVSPVEAFQMFLSANSTNAAFPPDCCQQLVVPGLGGLPSLAGASRKWVAPYTDALQSINGNEDTAFGGPLHFVASALKLVPTVITSDPNALYVWVGRDGEPYSGSRLCLTAKCIQSTIRVLNKSPLSTAGSVIPALAGPLSLLSQSPVSFSREDLFLVLWVPVLIAVLLGAWSLVARFCCSPARWQKVPPSCMIGCMVCQLPILFLLLAVIVPLFVFLSNACSSGANLGYNAVLAFGDGACTLLGGTGTASACAWALPLMNVTFNVTVDLPGAYAGLFGECGAADGPDALRRTFAGLAEQARAAPPAIAAQQLATPAFAALGPGLKGVLLGTTSALSASTATLIEYMGNTTLSCGMLQGVVTDVRETVCARVVAPLAWYVGAWAAAAWAMVVVGFPVMCLARKRLPAKVWGPSVLAAQEAFEMREDAALLAGTLKASVGVAGTFPLAAAAQAAAADAAATASTVGASARTVTSAGAVGGGGASSRRTLSGKMDVRTIKVAGKGERTATGGDVTLDVGTGGAGVSVGVKASPQKK